MDFHLFNNSQFLGLADLHQKQRWKKHPGIRSAQLQLKRQRLLTKKSVGLSVLAVSELGDVFLAFLLGRDVSAVSSAATGCFLSPGN
jgi:hypothetical protein